MKSIIAKVFLIIAVLMLALLAWRLFFAEGGVLQNGWNALGTQVNTTWKAVTGSNDGLIPEWNIGSANVNDAATDIGKDNTADCLDC